MSVTITDRAKNQLVQSLKEENKSAETHHLRVGVLSGGCSGLQYFMEFGEMTDTLDGDKSFDLDTIQLVVDKQSSLYLIGSQLDYSSGLNGKGFEWSNPNANRTCGCGESFSL
jgi:iron-sulfur cluster assembly protein